MPALNASEPSPARSPEQAGSALAPPTIGTEPVPVRLDPDAADGRRTLGRFGANLGRNSAGIFSGDNLGPWLIGGGAASSGALFDGRTQRFFGGRRRAAAFGSMGHTLGREAFVVPFVAGLFAAGRAARGPRFRAFTYDLAQASLVNAAYTGAIKVATRRERPDGSSRLSFPSGHASNAFAWASVAGRHYGRKAAIPTYALAGLIGLSRLERNVHHLSDVVAGAALGCVVGRTVAREDGAPVRERLRFLLRSVAAPSGDGSGLGITLLF